MESSVIVLFRKLIELGIFNHSWQPIQSSNYLICIFDNRIYVGIVNPSSEPSSLDYSGSTYQVFKDVGATSVVQLSGPAANPDGGLKIAFAEGKENFEQELENILQAMIDVYPVEVGEIASLGFSSMVFPNVQSLIGKLDEIGERLGNPLIKLRREGEEINLSRLFQTGFSNEPQATEEVIKQLQSPDKFLIGNEMKSTLLKLRSVWAQRQIDGIVNSVTDQIKHNLGLPDVSPADREAFIAKMKDSFPELAFNTDGSPDLFSLLSKGLRKSKALGDNPSNWKLGPKGYYPRNLFSNTEDYIVHLERVIELSRMSPEEFMEDSKRSAEELERMYPLQEVLLDVKVPDQKDPDVQEVSPLNQQINVTGYYIPLPDEPSPFGIGVNAWISWKRAQPNMTDYKGDFSTLARELVNMLEHEKPRHHAHVVKWVPSEAKTCDGHLSLGYVIHIRYMAPTPVSWDGAHNYALFTHFR